LPSFFYKNIESTPTPANAPLSTWKI